MRQNADACIKLILKHEGGFVNHPSDPGGATNRGVTIGTLRSLGMDLDGDDDVDVTDLRKLSEADAVKVYKRFYWDKVDADLLPGGVDYTVADFAVNSGPSRSAKHLQAALGVVQDGDIGPVTIEAALSADPAQVVNAICDSRMRFLQGLSIWRTFGRGWTNRVNDVRAHSLKLASHAVTPPATRIDAEPPAPAQSIFSVIINILKGLFK